MGNVLDNFKRLTLGRLLVLLSLMAVIIAFLLIFFMAEVIRDRAIHELAWEDARQTSKMVFQSLYSAMRKGWNKQEIKRLHPQIEPDLARPSDTRLSRRSGRQGSSAMRGG